MPQVLMIAFPKVIAVVVGALIKTAAVYAVSRMLTKSARSKTSGLGSGSDLVMSREPAPVRRIVYGETRVSGPMAFANISGNKNSTLCLAILLAAHECEAIGAYLVDDEQVTPGVGGAVTAGTYAKKLSMVSHLGEQTSADSLLMANAPGVWTSAHVLRGITYLAAKLTYDTDVYCGGLPNLSVILRGKKLYDPRTSATAWSSNPALILRDYLTNADYGLSCTADEIDDALIIAAANICDEAVALKSGGSEARYRCNGTFTTDAEPATIIETILSTMAGSITYSGGKFRVFAGAYSAPTVVLDEDDMAGAIEFQPAAGIREACNIVKGTFTSPADLYQPRDFPRFADASHITADGEEIATDLDLAWVSSSAQAQRLAKIYERKARLGGTVTLKCKLSAFRCQTGETIAVSNTRLGWSEKVFTVQEWRFAIASDGSLGVELTCRETASSIYDWEASDEVALTSTSAISNPTTTMENVTGAAANSVPGTYDDLNGGTGGGAPLGSIVVQARGGKWTLKGYAEWTDPSTPPRRYLTKTMAGSAYGTGNSGCTTTYSASGACTLNPSTDVWTNGATYSLEPSPESGGCMGPSGTSEMPVGSAGLTGATFAWSYTPTVATNTFNPGLWLTSSGAVTATLSNEDTPSTAIGRLLATAEWGEATSAIRTIPTDGITGLYRELRYRTEHTETAGEQVWVEGQYLPNGTWSAGYFRTVTTTATLPTLVGLTPWQRYQVTVPLESRPVDSAGAPTGDGSWSAAGARRHYFTANLTGEGGIDWQVVEPTAGYETRIGSILVEVA